MPDYALCFYDEIKDAEKERDRISSLVDNVRIVTKLQHGTHFVLAEWDEGDFDAKERARAVRDIYSH